MAGGLDVKPLLMGALPTLRLAERQGERCGGPITLAGLVLGLGVVQLSSGPLGQTSRFSLELLILLILKLVGPMLVALIAMALLLPNWLEIGPAGDQNWKARATASVLVGAGLLLLFLGAALTGGVLASPRSDLLAEFSEVLGGVLLSDLLRSSLRSALFLTLLCLWSGRRGQQRLRQGTPAALVSSNLLVEGLTLLLALKLLWILLIDPLQLSSSAP